MRRSTPSALVYGLNNQPGEKRQDCLNIRRGDLRLKYRGIRGQVDLDPGSKKLQFVFPALQWQFRIGKAHALRCQVGKAGFISWIHKTSGLDQQVNDGYFSRSLDGKNAKAVQKLSSLDAWDGGGCSLRRLGLCEGSEE